MHPRLLVLALLLSFAPMLAEAATPKIAVVAPKQGNLAILGKQIFEGARAAAGKQTELVEIPETCAEGSGPEIARQIIASQAILAIGFLCTDSLDGGLPALAEAKIPAITLSVRGSIIMEDALKKGWPLFRLAPSPTAERDRIIQLIFDNWKDQPFAILDDGTITSREMAEGVREALEAKGMKATFTDTFRPAQDVQTQLLRRLAKAGVTHVFAAADRGDMSVMAHDAKAAKLPLVFMGGDALDAAEQAVPLEKGVLAVTLPEFQALPPAKTLVDVWTGDGRIAEGYVLPAYAAVQIAVDAAEIAANSGAPLSDALAETPFETVIGTVTFNKAHELTENPFRLLEWNGTEFQPPVASQ